jgi:hypothetical protein
MARTTGPILAVGGITLANRSVFHGQSVDWRVPIATGIAAALFGLAERAWGDGAVALAWLALATVILTRVDRSVPSPAESALAWFQSAGPTK